MHAVLEDFFLPTKMFKSSTYDYVCIVHVTVRRTDSMERIQKHFWMDNETHTRTLSRNICTWLLHLIFVSLSLILTLALILCIYLDIILSEFWLQFTILLAEALTRPAAAQNITVNCDFIMTAKDTVYVYLHVIQCYSRGAARRFQHVQTAELVCMNPPPDGECHDRHCSCQWATNCKS